MTRSLLTCTAGLLMTALLFSTTLVAQEKIAPVRKVMLGGGLSGEVGMGWGDVPVYGGSTGCGSFTGGLSFGERVGGGLHLPKLFGDQVGFGGWLSLGGAQEYLTTHPVDPQRTLDAGTLSLVTIDRELRLNARSLVLRLDLPILWYPNDHLRFDVAPSVGLRFGTTFTATDKIISPASYSFPDGASERSVEGWIAPRSAGLSVGASIGAAWMHQISERLYLVPELRLRTEATSTLVDYPWQSASLSAGISLLADITSEPTLPDTAEVPLVVHTPRLAATLQLRGVDRQGGIVPVATIRVDEVTERQHIPFLPMIFFDEGEERIPSRYEQNQRADVKGFHPEDLVGLGPVEVHHTTLDVLGARLAETPSASITLFGGTSSDEPSSLAAARAARIRNYLVDVWEINSSRIRLSTAPSPIARSGENTTDGRAENRRVIISATVPAITNAVVTERLVRSFDPPSITILPTIDAEAGVKHWSLSVMQEERVLGAFKGDGTFAMPNEGIDWHILHDQIDSVLSPLHAELVIEDSAGGHLRITSQLPLEIDRHRRSIDPHVSKGGKRLVFLLTGFDYNGTQPGESGRELLQGVASQVTDSARIIITGYTDRIGGADYNITLSRTRAREVAAALTVLLEKRGLHGVTILADGAGIDRERFANDLPEGRVLSRSVSIEVDR